METIFGVPPGQGVKFGSYLVHIHPSGIRESVPVAIVRGKEPGPALSISANIHGDEYTGTLVLHELLRDEGVIANLKGTIVCLLSLNPLGSLYGQRYFSTTSKDPNRSFPEDEGPDQGGGNNLGNSKKSGVSFTEMWAEKIFLELSKTSDFHVDLHCSKIYSVPFIYVDPSLVKEKESIVRAAREGAEAFGFFVVRDNASTYFSSQYNRTLSGSLIHKGNIPSFTVELGPKKVVDVECISHGVTGIRNLLSHLGMLDEVPSPLAVALPPAKEEHEIFLHPRIKRSGVVKFLVKPGEKVEQGQPVATIRDIYGQDIGDGFVRTEVEGFVICQFEGCFFQPGEPILKIAVRKQDSEK